MPATTGTPPFVPTRGKAATGAVTPKDIWDTLESAGASSVQAAAIMGNMILESRLDPESAGMDTNGQMSYGLVQWNAADYPDAHSLVTGHPMADMVAQIKFLAQTGGFKAASGTTPAQAAGNFAAKYERCASCQPGGQQNTARESQAQTVAGWAQQDSWPASLGTASDTATLTAAQQAQGSAECAWMIGGNIPVLPFGLYTQTLTGCVLSKSQLRGIEGVTLMIFGAQVLGFGILLLLSSSGGVRQRVESIGGKVAKAAVLK